MRFGSVCSGIEAATVAWHELGWRAAWLAEIEKFPAAVLAHHYPEVPNLGDMTALPARIAAGTVDAPDIFCGGTPCQAFSVAGLRKSLDDARGNLSLVFCEIANAIDTARAVRGRPPAVIFWENVPGVLSTKDNAFGCFLGGLAGEDGPLEPPGGKWTNAGCVSGPQRAVAWRVLDAQYFGVAQRRRRVFVVASARKGFDPAQVLFEWDGVRRDTAPSREARQVAPTIPARSTAGGGLGTDFDCDGGTICVATGQAGAEIGADMAPTLNCNHEAPYVAHALRGEGFDASEDGTGRGTPLVPMFLHTNKGRPDGRRSAHTEMVSVKDIVGTLTTNGHAQSAVAVPVAYGIRTANTSSNGWGIQEECTHTLDCAQGVAVAQPVAFDTTQITSAANRSNPQPGDPCHPLAAGAHAPAIAFPANLSGTQCASAVDVAPSMGAANPTAVVASVHAIQAGALRVNPASGPGGVGVQADHAYTLEARAEVQAVQSAMQVRRLTPVECEKLQGFPAVSEKITIEACLDHQNQSVRVALKCLRWQNSALSAEESALTQPAKTADVPSSTSPAHLAPLAALHVRMHSVDELLEIRSAGRLIWSASGAGQSERSLPPTLTENSVQELARLLREAARTITAGKAASPPPISLSFPASSGATSAEKFGRETEVSASGAMNDQSRGMFTTSDLGLITVYSGSTVETLCCSALRAIAGCIPNKTLPETFSIELTVETPYTAIPWRGKPADQCPDGPRYRALGNSWAIPVVRWIGQRIDSVLSRGQTRPSHVEAAQKRSTPESGEQRRDRAGS